MDILCFHKVSVKQSLDLLHFWGPVISPADLQSWPPPSHLRDMSIIVVASKNTIIFIFRHPLFSLECQEKKSNRCISGQSGSQSIFVLIHKKQMTEPIKEDF